MKGKDVLLKLWKKLLGAQAPPAPPHATALKS